METVVPLNGMRACKMKEDRNPWNGTDEERKERHPSGYLEEVENEMGGRWKNARAHPVRFSDKISNLKFHRNFTILGSKLIVLSARYLPSYLCATLCHPKPVPRSRRLFVLSRPNPPTSLMEPPVRERNFENKQPITHYSPPLSEDLPCGIPFLSVRKVSVRTRWERSRHFYTTGAIVRVRKVDRSKMKDTRSTRSLINFASKSEEIYGKIDFLFYRLLRIFSWKINISILKYIESFKLLWILFLYI